MSADTLTVSSRAFYERTRYELISIGINFNIRIYPAFVFLFRLIHLLPLTLKTINDSPLTVPCICFLWWFRFKMAGSILVAAGSLYLLGMSSASAGTAQSNSKSIDANPNISSDQKEVTIVQIFLCLYSAYWSNSESICGRLKSGVSSNGVRIWICRIRIH